MNVKVERFLVFLVLLSGCAFNPIAKQSAINIWRSSSSTPEQLVSAVNSLCVKGATLEDVKAVLGAGGWNHWHGSSQDAYFNATENLSKQPPVDYDFWTLDYPKSNGAISLRFENINSPTNRADYRFVSASYNISLLK
jgi:hypothetical protein